MSQPEIRNAIVLVVDRLGSNMLGAYGSTWFETQNFNRLAARSVIFDQAISESTDLARAYDGLWDAKADKNLMQSIGQSGISPVLLTDELAIKNLPLVADFDRIIPIETNSTQGIASSIDQTELAHFFAQAAQAVGEVESGSCLWIHSRGLAGAWDAPNDLRTRLADPDDPEPPQFYEAPARVFDPKTDDPDELLGYQQVCAAQVTLIDDFLGVLLDILETDVEQSTMLCLLSTRGYPLGEHGLVGQLDDECFGSCFSESVHVPMMVCLPNRPEFEFARSVRNGSLVQPTLIAELLADWFGPSDSITQTISSLSNSLPEKASEVACTINGPFLTLQTHAWKLIRGASESATQSAFRTELFAKPDDRCEVNDVSRRCPHIVESLSQTLDRLIVDGKLKVPDGFILPAELANRLD